MLVSVILPTRDRPDWLPRAVESVITQTSPDWELVILDNSTSPYYERSPWHDSRVRYQHELCDGIADASTRALRLASGDVIVPLADDDQLAPNCIQTVLDAFADPTVMWANAITEIRGPDGRVTGHRGGTRDSVQATRSGSYWLGGAVWWRQELTATIGYQQRFDGAADFDLYLRFLEHHDEPLLIETVMYLYTDHPGTDSRQRLGVQLDRSAAIAREFQERQAVTNRV